MKIAIMQPYFMPYIGYFQLINAVDTFVIYDNIQYTKKGWINRNRILVNGKEEYITLPLKKDSDFLNIVDRELSSTWHTERVKLLNKIKESYRKAPHFLKVMPLIELIINFEDRNLFKFIYNSLLVICDYIEIETSILISSSIKIDHGLKSQDKVIAISKNLSATHYINSIGGVDLYSKAIFESQNLQLSFIQSNPIEYRQFDNDFLPLLTIIDVMMFNSKEEINKFLSSVSFQ